MKKKIKDKRISPGEIRSSGAFGLNEMESNGLFIAFTDSVGSVWNVANPSPKFSVIIEMETLELKVKSNLKPA